MAQSKFRRSMAAAWLILLVWALSLMVMPAFAEAAAPVSVKLGTRKTLKIPLGANYTLVPTLNPAGADTTFTWKSSNRKIATVKNGVVRPKRTGTTKITVVTRNKKRASVKIKVYDPTLPSSVKLDVKGTVRLPVGMKLTLKPALSPEAARSGFRWKSSKKKVATVSKGVVTAKKPGTTKITVVTRNRKKASVKVKVVKGGSASVISSQGYSVPLVTATDGTLVLPSSTESDSSAYVSGEDSETVIVTPEDYSLPYVVYACLDSHTIAILTRDDSGGWNRVIRLFPTGAGRNHSTDVGTFYITKKERWHEWNSGYSPYANGLSVGIYIHGPIYKSKNHYTIRPSYYNGIGTDCSSGCLRTICGCAAWIYFNCPVGTMVVVAQDSRFSTPRPAKLAKNMTSDPTDPGSNPEILVTGFEVVPSALTLNPGDSQPLMPVNITPANANPLGFSYASSNASVAAVNAAGIVTAINPGSAVISVRANDDYGCAVSVPVNINVGAAVSYEMLSTLEMDDIAGDEPFTAEAVDTEPEAFIMEETVPEDEAITEAEVIADGMSEPMPETPGDYDNGLTMEAGEPVSEEQLEIMVDQE